MQYVPHSPLTDSTPGSSFPKRGNQVSPGPAMRNLKSSGFFVRYSVVLKEIPYSEDYLYESRSVISQAVHS